MKLDAWTNENVADWLRTHNYGYVDEFKAHKVAGRHLAQLNLALLKEIGVMSVKDRARLISALAQLVESQRKIASAGFVFPDGRHVDVDVDGCFDALSIKKRALRANSIHDQPDMYSVFVLSAQGPRMIADHELVAICHDSNRKERDALIICLADLIPTEKQYAVVRSKSTRRKHSSSTRIRKFFGQRPPSELISSNLGEYFPEQNKKVLERTVINSMRRSVRLSRMSRASMDSTAAPVSYFLSSPNPTVGDNWFNAASRPLSVVSSKRFSTATAGMLPAIPDAPPDAPPDTQSATTQASDRNSFSTLINRLSLNLEDSISALDLDEDFPDDGTDNADPSAALRWIKGSVIGSGSFGTVVLGMNVNTGALMAVKQVEVPSGSVQGEKRRQNMLDSLRREIELLRDLDHENIVKYHGSTWDQNVFNIFLEYVPGGSVASLLSNYGAFEEPLVRSFVRQILLGLAYLHNRDIIHRDIKGANILVDNKGGVKIGDFGISKRMDKDLLSTTRNRASLQGSVYWMAPEVVRQTRYTKKADIWSLGCLVVEMFTGTHPFPEFTQMQALFKIGQSSSPALPEDISPEARTFLELSFASDHTKRPDADELLNLPFLEPLIT
ncbi:hypothetical protein CANCADRAFT_30775, partial [Tortispora caseinolytica NRRL Y-17796]